MKEFLKLFPDADRKTRRNYVLTKLAMRPNKRAVTANQHSYHYLKVIEIFDADTNKIDNKSYLINIVSVLYQFLRILIETQLVSPKLRRRQFGHYLLERLNKE